MPEQIDRGPADDEDPRGVAEGLGGVTGAAAGAGLGAILGPAGIVVGGLAGALGGWWAGRGVADAAGGFKDETDAHYRQLHESRHADRADYESARGFYHLGGLARRNPSYEGRSFDDIEPELRQGFRDDAQHERFRSWDDVRPFVRCGYDECPD